MKKKSTFILLSGLTLLSCGFVMGMSFPDNQSHLQFFSGAEVFSAKYLVNNSERTISDIPFAESSEDFYKNIQASPGATMVLKRQDGITPANDLQTGYKLLVTSQDSELINTYTIILDELPGDLFFSEYIEGNSNNKALEIFNKNNFPVKLKYFRIVESVNGGGWKDYHTFPEGASIDEKGVWVIINNKTSVDVFDTVKANEKVPGVVGFNGDDARGLLKIIGIDTILVDVIGNPDEDPGNGWDVAGIKNATQNKTLIRKSTITTGNSNWISSAGTNENDSEWIVMPIDHFSDLGIHIQDSIILVSDINRAVQLSDVKIYPNPANEFLYVENLVGQNNLIIIDISGRILISMLSTEIKEEMGLDQLKSGIYFIIVKNTEEQRAIKFIKK